MEKRAIALKSRRSGAVSVRVIEGHFATKHSHVSHCIDMTKVKSEYTAAREAARLFYEDFQYVPVDTIISLERMKMIGAFHAGELTHSGINKEQNIAVISPEMVNEKLLLRDNFIPYVKNRRVLVLTASATTGQTLLAAIEGIKYYGGEVTGAATVFGGDFKELDVPTARLFGVEDIARYTSYSPAACPLCAKGVKVDAVVNSYGYSKI